MASCFLVVVLLICLITGTEGFSHPFPGNRCRVMAPTSLSMVNTDVVNSFLEQRSHLLGKVSMFLADSGVSEDDVLVATGQQSELPDPAFAIVFAAVLLIGVGALQFSLGDITKEEGQARVRDFLATKRDTERKRGYFD